MSENCHAALVIKSAYVFGRLHGNAGSSHQQRLCLDHPLSCRLQRPGPFFPATARCLPDRFPGNPDPLF